MRCGVCNQNTIHQVGADCQNPDCATNWDVKAERLKNKYLQDLRDKGCVCPVPKIEEVHGDLIECRTCQTRVKTK